MRVLLYLLILTSLTANSQDLDNIGGENWNISNGILQTKGNLNDTIALKYWNFLNNLLPSEILNKYVFSLRLFTDGREEELGGMSPMNDFNSKWEIDIDTLDFSFNNKNVLYVRDYLHTVIHEFGHLLVLNPEQVEITDDEFQDNDKGYLTIEGYASDSSYLGKFVNLFWNHRMLKRWDKIDKIRNENRKINLLLDFYLKNKHSFLTDYAAESPEEDIAESWTFFVLSDKPNLNEVRHKKVLFFYKFPKLVAYRKSIRENIESIPIDYIENYKQRFYD